MINIRITEIDRPFCQGCGQYCKANTKGIAINLNYGSLITCDDCYSKLVAEIVRKEKLKLEEKKDGATDKTKNGI